MRILVLNCGSSSVKFQVIETDRDRIRREADRRLACGLVERIGGEARASLGAEGKPSIRKKLPARDHREALDAILGWIGSPASGIGAGRVDGAIDAVGHRVVHGGERFNSSVRIDRDVVAAIEECSELAPLHNPSNLEGIRAVKHLLGDRLPQVAVFDTAFHSTLPAVSFLYGIPYAQFERNRIRRYGFHGTSHRYVCDRYRRMTGIPRRGVNVISLHLGNGCSVCAVRGGASVDTSMGFTPLEGLLMGTRCGDLDPSILEYLARVEGRSLEAIGAMLNRESGLLGLSGRSADMRDLLAAESKRGGRRARTAIEIFCYRARKYIGAYFVAMQGAAAVIFTGGIGENSPVVRRRICEGLDSIGLRIDRRRNERAANGAAREISTSRSRFKAFVIPTDEELLIARDTYELISSRPARR